MDEVSRKGEIKTLIFASYLLGIRMAFGHFDALDS